MCMVNKIDKDLYQVIVSSVIPCCCCAIAAEEVAVQPCTWLQYQYVTLEDEYCFISLKPDIDSAHKIAPVCLFLLHSLSAE